ncbi:uncharacterized protein TrAtP1_003431 [Trichoderma atroviride]|uniref:uncharacterized protein n=1 Tax=Hypocrea atroviridis TaxID=63577 RepID=UPI003330E08E|nr:hypothetical protein TrAtP1_003431 [Trichoderma atroviride]
MQTANGIAMRIERAHHYFLLDSQPTIGINLLPRFNHFTAEIKIPCASPSRLASRNNVEIGSKGAVSFRTDNVNATDCR